LKDCIFCKIITDPSDAYVIYQDDKYLALLDIFPRVKGHVLVISKTHFTWVDEVENFGEYFEVAKTIGLAAKKALGADWVSYLTVGVDIPHAHIHVLPRKTGDQQTDVVNFDKILKLSNSEMQNIANLYRTKIGGV
jgi:histidine triad (HIT) family protein